MACDSGLLSPVRAGTPVESIVDDDAWLAALLETEGALARAQAAVGTVPPEAAAVITEVAGKPGIGVREIALAARESANPVVALVQHLTRAVAERDPAAAEFVHRGSTSQDILDTAEMLLTRRALAVIRDDLRRAAAALGQLAADHRDTLVAGRTLGLHAVPTTFGLKAAGWRSLLLDAADRVGAVTLPVSLGGAAGTLAGYLEAADGRPAAEYLDALATAFAAETGLARPGLPWHALRTPLADLAAALGFTAAALGKVAVDVQFLARTEVAEVSEPTAPGRGSSSAMPHKRNPVLATLIRSAALQVPALAGALTQCLVSEDERSGGAWHAEWLLLRECLRLTGGATHTAVELTEGLDVHPDRMAANLGLTGAQVVSERVGAVLLPLLGKQAARRAASEAAAETARTGRPLADVLAARPDLDGVLTRAELDAICDPGGYTGAAGLLVDQTLGGQR